jgi:hypothetical protein
MPQQGPQDGPVHAPSSAKLGPTIAIRRFRPTQFEPIAELEQIAYDSALGALDKQEKVLEELRARTGILLAASSLAASLLGGRALDEFDPLWLAVTSSVSFITSLGASLFVLTPRSGFVFSLKGPAVHEELFEFREDPDGLHRRLSYDLQRFWDTNDCLLTPWLISQHRHRLRH